MEYRPEELKLETCFDDVTILCVRFRAEQQSSSTPSTVINELVLQCIFLGAGECEYLLAYAAPDVLVLARAQWMCLCMTA
jgi:hypothetical protein